ncbi:uncharacterized protein LOC129611822 [Condylostylus longicornis]|uniref:uncharacterized protein LOC129611822 n=1 Tax=Condylostylus longicornis TaxID=2530218 RepID=UPI00244DC9F5|nr:uncharacterized protein LOC129611822 [Condylostylus longicornis]
MNLPSDILIFLFINNLFRDITGLRLSKVVIPAYKLRGESVFLECQYELNRSNGGIIKSSIIDSTISGIGYHRSKNKNQLPLQQQQQLQQHQQQQPQEEQQEYYHKKRSQQQSLIEQKQQKQKRYYRQLQQQQQQQLPQPTFQQQFQTQTYKIYDETKIRDHLLNIYDSSNEPNEDDGEQLYAVKWYKDNEEFYRYVPKANPQKQSYRVDGIRVIEEHSDSSRVLLRGLTLNSTGLYRCEVSAEAPNFSSVQGEGRMDIVYLPRDGPHIKGKEDQYQIGDTLNLNCTSGKSHPASQLQWFINDKLLVNSDSLIRYNDTIHKHGLITSTLGLQLTVDARHFQEGAMKVKCLASISPVLWKGGRESVLQRRPGVIDNREAMLLVLSSSSSIVINSFVLGLIILIVFCQLLDVKLR